MGSTDVVFYCILWYNKFMVILRNKKIISIVLTACLIVGLIPVYHNAGAISKACQNSAAFREAV